MFNKTKTIQSPRKTFQKAGKWIERPTKMPILLCACGSKYIKTRKDQTSCVKCLVKNRSVHEIAKTPAL